MLGKIAANPNPGSNQHAPLGCLQRFLTAGEEGYLVGEQEADEHVKLLQPAEVLCLLGGIDGKHQAPQAQGEQQPRRQNLPAEGVTS